MNKYAMIFSAGMGTRLGEISKHTPKALVQILDKPLLEHILVKIKDSGFTHVVVNVHHHAKQIIYFAHNLDFEELSITISDESEKLLDTGGGLKYAQNLFADAEHILLHNVDVISNIDLSAMYSAHCNKNNLASLAVKERKTSRYLLFDNNNLLKGWQDTRNNQEIRHSQEQLNPMAFSGIHIVSKRIFNLFPAKDVFSMTEFYLDICNDHKIKAYNHNKDLWVDVGNPEHFSIAEQIICPSP